jgi:lysophospholipase L1-like esterase
MERKISKVIIFLSIIAIVIIGIFLVPKSKPLVKLLPIIKLIPTVTPQQTPTPKIFKPIDQYEEPKIAIAPSYTLLFLGDSMTEALGENFDDLRLDLTKYYSKKVFGLFNYGFGSTNILSAEDRLNHDTVYQGKNFPAILNRYFDVILIESFGNNPLSELPLDQGLQKQTAALDQMVAELTDTHPNSLIIFIATVAPSSLYGKGVVALSPQERIQWANERRAYIENHISYAKKHNIPLINVYEKTLDKNGLTINKYINPGTYIHPSSAGVSLISQMVADYLYQNHILLN